MATNARFGAVARRQQARFRETLSPAAQEPTDDKGLWHGHLLALGFEMENLIPAVRGDGGALRFFADRGIKWWTNSRSGDRKGYVGPTRNLASSQVSCINFLLPLISIPGALLSIVRRIDPDAVEIEAITDANGNSSPVEFEWVGWRQPLEGGPITRGANQTSLDALVVARTASGRTAYLIEWKYSEEYLNPDYKGEGESGETRRGRYQRLYETPASSFNGNHAFNDMLYDPFYQLMRMVLLGDRMLVEGVTEAARIDDFRLVVVCPAANTDYRCVAPRAPLGQNCSPGATVHDVFRGGLKNASRLHVVAQEDLVSSLRSGPLAGDLVHWLEYHQLRYGW